MTMSSLDDLVVTLAQRLQPRKEERRLIRRKRQLGDFAGIGDVLGLRSLVFGGCVVPHRHHNRHRNRIISAGQ